MLWCVSGADKLSRLPLPPLYHYSRSARAHIPLADYQTNLQTIVQKLLDGGSERVLLVTPSPVYDGAPQALPTGEVSNE